MISIKTKTMDYIWFGDKISYQKYPFKEFVLNKSGNFKIGFLKEKKYTKVIDLLQTEEVILKSFSKRTKYEINRSAREEVQFGIENSLEVLIDFHNDFAKQKGLSPLGNPIRKMADYIVITQASHEGKVLVMHSYIIDRQGKRVRMNTSASHFRGAEDKDYRNFVARSNRFLHYQSMVHFKKEGFEIYDFGGYALGTKDPGLQSINRFKDSFKGTLIEEHTYTPVPMFFIKKMMGKD